MTDISPSLEPVQVEALEFNQPVSEASLTSIGAAANGALVQAASGISLANVAISTLTGFTPTAPVLHYILPVGSIVETMLTEAQFVSQTGTALGAIWVLADGRNVAGSTYNGLTGSANVPDLRGVFTRGKDNGRSLDPNGNLPLGTYVADELASHTHNIVIAGPLTPAIGASITGSFATPGAATNNFGTSPLLNTLTGGAETAPKYVVTNKMIRIN